MAQLPKRPKLFTGLIGTTVAVALRGTLRIVQLLKRPELITGLVGTIVIVALCRLLLRDPFSFRPVAVLSLCAMYSFGAAALLVMRVRRGDRFEIAEGKSIVDIYYDLRVAAERMIELLKASKNRIGAKDRFDTALRGAMNALHKSRKVVSWGR